MCRHNCCAKSSQEEEVISPPDENLLIYCKPVRLYNILRIRSLFNVNQLRLSLSLNHSFSPADTACLSLMVFVFFMHAAIVSS